jgi:hypothetical protein
MVRDGMRSVVLAAESTRETIAKFDTRDDFDRKPLLGASQCSSNYRATRLYDTVPVVAAWKTIETGPSKKVTTDPFQ